MDKQNSQEPAMAGKIAVDATVTTSEPHFQGESEYG